MSSPGRREQRGFVFGNGVVKPQAPRSQPEDAEPQELAEHYSTETLCLSRTQLKHVSLSILKNSSLKFLYLEGNQISSIPDALFISLPNLLWLDLRNNQIASLPAEIGLHRSLKTLLLEGNPILELPPELGNVITLRGLNLRNCPITFPPQDIVHQGLRGILQYLRSVMAKRQVSTRKAPPVVSLVELPVVEKLQLSELRGSSMEEQDEAGDEDELQRFKELKQQMILLDQAELGDRKPKSRHLLPIPTRTKATTEAGIIPELPLFDTQRWKSPEESRQPAMKEKQAAFEQRRKSQETLRIWRTKAKITQEKKISAHKPRKNQRQKKREGAEAGLKPGVEDSSDSPQTLPITEYEETRSARELERQIRARVEKVQERRRNPRGTASEQMAAAERDVEEMRKLQARLLERNRNLGGDVENCFTIFTGNTWSNSPEK